MKLYVGPYTNWIGPYQIADMIFFWLEKYPSNELEQRWDYQLHDKFGHWLSDTWVNDFCQWIDSKKKRKVKIRIDNYDTWSADHTLSIIAVPLLKQLHATKHGAPFVDDEDVPDELKSTSAPPKENEWDTDDNHFKRWDWVLEEMIWAHEQLGDPDSDIKFWDSTKDVWDKEGQLLWQERKKNGLRLFGKYYENLWD